jgi:methylmalonyl-CoA mutase cobalamin-binding domain/chain
MRIDALRGGSPAQPPLDELTAALLALDERRTLALAEQALGARIPALQVVHAAETAMRGVGERYERQEIYLAGLIMAGEVFRRVLELAQPGLEAELTGDAQGTVLLGTAAGDIHDIGKNTVALTLRIFGFTVIDLGVDVAPGRFAEEALRRRADIVGISGLVTAAHRAMGETVARLRTLSPPGRCPPVIIGGGTIDREVARSVGADSWTTDAMEGVRLCQRLLEET